MNLYDIDSDLLYDNGITGNKPFLSICFSTYQVANMLEEALAAIFRQEITDFEPIISDDCSVDGTVDIVHRWLTVNDEKGFPVRLFRSRKNHWIVER